MSRHYAFAAGMTDQCARFQGLSTLIRQSAT